MTLSHASWLSFTFYFHYVPMHSLLAADEHHSSLGPETLHFDDSTHPMKLQTQPTISKDSEGFG
jgi:hypothetical protein